MSSMMIDAHASGDTQQDTRHDVGVEAHPRGKGFRVLSRIARAQADDDGSDYAPRHRLDVPADADVHSSIAS
jgi:hypothetical protein